ncbi:unnamed protein product [Arctogadus glacialis]
MVHQHGEEHQRELSRTALVLEFILTGCGFRDGRPDGSGNQSLNSKRRRRGH